MCGSPTLKLIRLLLLVWHCRTKISAVADAAAAVVEGRKREKAAHGKIRQYQSIGWPATLCCRLLSIRMNRRVHFDFSIHCGKLSLLLFSLSFSFWPVRLPTATALATLSLFLSRSCTVFHRAILSLSFFLGAIYSRSIFHSLAVPLSAVVVVVVVAAVVVAIVAMDRFSIEAQHCVCSQQALALALSIHCQCSLARLYADRHTERNGTEARVC